MPLLMLSCSRKVRTQSPAADGCATELLPGTAGCLNRRAHALGSQRHRLLLALWLAAAVIAALSITGFHSLLATQERAAGNVVEPLVIDVMELQQGQPPSLPAAAPSPQRALLSTTPGTCAVSITYWAVVYDPQGPDFKGYWQIKTTQQSVPALRSWALGWTFTAGERMLFSGDESEFSDYEEQPGGPAPATVRGLVLQDSWPGGSVVRPFQSVTVMVDNATTANGTLSDANGTDMFFTHMAIKGPAAVIDRNASSDSSQQTFLDGPPYAPMRAASPTDVFVNNMACMVKEQVSYAPITVLIADAAAGADAASNSSTAGGQQQQTAEAAGNDTSPAVSLLTADYSSTLMNITLSNNGSSGGEVIPLHSIQVQYWFQGSNDTAEAAATAGNITDSGGRGSKSASPFEMKCWYINPAQAGLDCSMLTWNISRATNGVPGAQYVLALGFVNTTAGNLVPRSGSSANDGTDGSQSYSDEGTSRIYFVELVISIAPTGPGSKLNAQQDYSHMNTPVLFGSEDPLATPDLNALLGTLSAGDGIARILLPRQSLPNPRIPAYLDNFIAWGSPPNPAWEQPAAVSMDDQQQGQGQPVTTDINSVLPPGSYCDEGSDGGLLYCQWKASYCCNTISTETAIVTELPPYIVDAITSMSQLPPPSPPQALSPGKKAAIIIGSVAAFIGILIAAVLLLRRRWRHDGRGEGGGDNAWDDGFGGGGDGFDRGSMGSGQRGMFVELHRLQQQPPYHVLDDINVTASEADELRSVVDAAWWQRNSPHQGGPMGQQGLLPKYPTMPAEAFMAHVEALSPPTTRELREHLLASVSGVGCLVGGRTAEAAVAETAEVEHIDTWAAAAVTGLQDDGGILLRILTNKAKTWAGRVSETWELLPDYPPHLLLPPLQPPEPAGPQPEAAELEPCPDAQPPTSSLLHTAVTRRMPSLAHDEGRGCGTAGVAALPMSLSMGPIELDVDFETEVAPNLVRLIGVGGFGRVYEGTWRGRKVAVKTVTIDSEAQRQALAKEAQITARFSCCERIVQLLGVSLGPSSASGAAASHGGGGRKISSGGGTETTSSSGDHNLAPATPAQPLATETRHGEVSNPGTETHVISPPVGGQQQQQGVPPPPPGDPASTQQPPSSSRSVQGGGQQPLLSALGCQQLAALIMELCEGGNLGDRIRHPHMRRLEYLEVLQLCRDVAEGLAHLHRFGVLHRDLKPGNVLLDSKGRAKIADFGISRLQDPARSWISVTAPGGTINYMAPELFNGSHVDERADIYSLGCIMYEALTRQVPFGNMQRGAVKELGSRGGAPGGEAAGGGMVAAGNPAAVIMAVAVLGKRPELPDWVPRGLAELITACWAEDPKARPAAAQVFFRLDALIAQELARRALRVPWATAGGGRPRVSCPGLPAAESTTSGGPAATPTPPLTPAQAEFSRGVPGGPSVDWSSQPQLPKQALGGQQVHQTSHTSSSPPSAVNAAAAAASLRSAAGSGSAAAAGGQRLETPTGTQQPEHQQQHLQQQSAMGRQQLCLPASPSETPAPPPQPPLRRLPRRAALPPKPPWPPRTTDLPPPPQPQEGGPTQNQWLQLQIPQQPLEPLLMTWQQPLESADDNQQQQQPQQPGPATEVLSAAAAAAESDSGPAGVSISQSVLSLVQMGAAAFGVAAPTGVAKSSGGSSWAGGSSDDNAASGGEEAPPVRGSSGRPPLPLAAAAAILPAEGDTPVSAAAKPYTATL
ncbi:hypothetical protein PLESTM_000574800 [Pleodorina starrii]|nr:hypothetical protein PLESTM_000574800 [Pleodorina starrii]